ncbi:transporter [Lithospermum erythrorhizon]|uniref:Transporter n=1 Tax=Lithospermum erythrorhizon TaxID=34254 RepID=A0AAV3NT23_LITER
MEEIGNSTAQSPEGDHNEVNKKANLSERKISWAKLRRVDSLTLEAGQVSFKSNHQNPQTNWARTMSLAFQSLGVIYGDIGTSPLYVYASTFPDGIKNNNDILGVLSLIIYTLVLIPMIKYVLIVLWANDNGDGGTFALYSLICRYAKVSLIPNDQPEDNQLSHYKLSTPSKHLWRAQKIKEKLETSKTVQVFLFLVTILGTSMVIGDGVLTPSISVLSAVDGIDALSQDARVGVSIGILIMIFSVQRFGTDKVGFSFAPIVCLWFSFIGVIGLHNLIKYDIGVLRALNPKYIIDYFQRHGKDAWVSLGGVVLCITGTSILYTIYET